MSRLLLNCDIGESFGSWTMGLDAEVMPFIDCANVACGFHAGDPGIMRKTVSLALSHGVQIGAHPAYQDLVGAKLIRHRTGNQENCDSRPLRPPFPRQSDGRLLAAPILRDRT